MTPEVFCVGNGIDFSAVDDGFGDNVNTLGKKGLWLKLDGDSHQIGMRWGNSPEDMLLWQVEPSGYGIIKPFMDRIASDQSRIRENMKALKGTAEEKALIQRYTGELNAQEDRLAAIRRELEDLQRSRDQAAAELDRMVMAMDIDESL